MRPLTACKSLALAVALAATCGTVAAQDYAFGWNPRSGDVWVDQRLGDMNQYGTRYREPFIDEVSRYYGAPRDLVSDLVVRQRWAPGDVYYACSLAQVIGKPCRYVVDEYSRDPGQGWGAVAQRLGVKPGSPEFHRLKKGFVPTYDRWSRPIALDDELQRAFPDRGKGNNGKGNSAKAHDGHGDAHPGGHGKPATGKPPGQGKPAATQRKPADAGKPAGKGGKDNPGKGNDGKGNDGKGKG
jgi:hypothetical protein